MNPLRSFIKSTDGRLAIWWKRLAAVGLLGSVANLPSILATSSALLHLISTCKGWVFILIRDWDPTTAAIHDQNVRHLNANRL